MDNKCNFCVYQLFLSRMGDEYEYSSYINSSIQIWLEKLTRLLYIYTRNVRTAIIIYIPW